MNELFMAETERLHSAWMRHGGEKLARYLVRDVQDPRINLASILTRQILLEEALGNRLAGLMLEERRFAVIMNWFLERIRAYGPRHLDTLLDALLDGSPVWKGSPVPAIVSTRFQELPGPVGGVEINNYVHEVLLSRQDCYSEQAIPEHVLNTFERLWSSRLAQESAAPISVLEIACGSANDYRFFDSFGLAQFLDYRGVDLCEKNISNARSMFPGVAFEVGNVLALRFDDQEFEYCMVHDLLEHLSIPAMHQAIDEICRVTSRAVLVGFFSLHDIPDHVVVPVRPYYRNKLSLRRVRDLFRSHGLCVEGVPLARLVASQYQCEYGGNPGACILTARRTE